MPQIIDFYGGPVQTRTADLYRTRDRSVLVGKLAEILRDQRPTRKVAAMFIDMAFGSPIYERLRALGFHNVFETAMYRPIQTCGFLSCEVLCTND